MTGVTKGGQRDFLQGTALIDYFLSDTGGRGDIRASFSGIKNLSQNKAYSVRDVIFLDVPVEELGSFSKTENDRSIKGAFYGEEHEEITGIFETLEMLGAFGTKSYPPRTED